MDSDGLSILSGYVQGLPQNLAEGEDRGYLSGFLWVLETEKKIQVNTSEKILVIHINIQKKGLYMAVEMILGEMIEKSLKQREQLEGYLKDTYTRYKADDFGFLNDEEQEKKKLIMKGYISSYE